MKIKNNDLADFVDRLGIDKQDKVFVKNGLKKMVSELNNDYEKTVDKANKALEKAQKKFEKELEDAKEKVLNSGAEKIMGMFNITKINATNEDNIVFKVQENIEDNSNGYLND